MNVVEILPLPMAFTRTHKRRLKDGTTRTYYERVESYREGGKVHQRRVRYLGISPFEPIPLPPVHLGLLATRLATGACSPQDIFDFVQGMGVELPRVPLEALDIRYDFPKKTSELRLYPSRPSDRPPSRAGRPPASPARTPRTSAPSKGKGL